MDTAIKAEWYDLDDADREGFLAWLHAHHLPKLQAWPGHIWIGHYARAPKAGADADPPGHPVRIETDDMTVPRGSQYLLVTAAATPDVFFDPNHQAQPDSDSAAMLEKRKGYRFCIFIEETRVSGPDWYRHLPGTGAPPAIQLGNYQTHNQNDDMELGLWYRQMKLPQVTRARGCIGARKLISIVGWAKHGVLYEFTDMDPGEKDFERRFREAGMSERWPGRHVLKIVTHAPHGPLAGRRIWPPL